MSYESAPGIRRSDLWVINKTPRHFKSHMAHKEDEKSKALEFGIAVHMHTLDLQKFTDKYLIVGEDIDRRTKAGRETYKSILECCRRSGKTPLDEEEYEKIKSMFVSLKFYSPLAWQLLQGEHEKEYYWTDDLTGEQCKCKVDCITEYQGKPYIVDYKTTDSCEDGAFERSARKYGYQFQAGMYCEGLFQNTFKEHGFAFVAQEKNPPYAVRVYICDPEWIKRGYDKFRELIGIYHYCKETDNWYGYEGADGLPAMLMEDD